METDANVFLKSGYGKIKSDLPAYYNDEEETLDRKKGEGKTIIRLETSGDITLREE